MSNKAEPVLNIPAFAALRAHLKANITLIGEHLEMDSYVENDDNVSTWHDRANSMLISDGEIPCNSTACLAGWAATSKHPLLVPLPDEKHWNVYVNRVFFNLDSTYILNNTTYDFIFSGGWANDINAGIVRLDYLIEHGKPDEDYCDRLLSL